MNSAVILLGKFVSIGLWAAVIVTLLSPFPEPYHGIFVGAGVLIGLAHVAECAMFMPVIKQHSKNVPADLAQVLLFGVFHIKTVQQRGGE